MLQITDPVAPVRASPDAGSQQVSQCLLGEQVELLERCGVSYRVRNRRDNYEGYVAESSLGAAVTESTHRVNCRSTLLFTEANIKSPIRHYVPYSAELIAQAYDERFLKTHDDCFVIAAHCHETQRLPLFGYTAISSGGSSAHSTLAESELDLVTIAESLFAGCPYVWGGRSPQGCDCSGLLQLSAFALGHSLPRDSGPQEQAIEIEVPFAQRRRNDIVFWPGHVGILKDAGSLFHATAHSMLTVLEPLEAVIERAGRPSSVRRLQFP